MAKRKDAKRATGKASDQIDRELAARAIEKRKLGQAPLRQELAALRRIEQQTEQEKRWEYYKSIPLVHWREMSGRQHKILREQAERYGIPFDQKKIDLPAVVMRLHNFLAENAQRFAKSHKTDEDLFEGLEQKRRIEAQLKQLQLDEATQRLLPRDAVHDVFTQIAATLRSASMMLGKRHGKEAQRVLDEALDEIERITKAKFRDGHGADKS